MTRVEVHHGAATDVGRVREVNEDAYLVAPPVFVVADGMGGHDAGDVASAIVVEEFARLAAAGYPTDDEARGAAEAVVAALDASQTRLQEYADAPHSSPTGRAPGTTVVAALLVEAQGEPAWLLVNLGDSRIYRVHEQRLEQVSVDHSLVQELVEAGSITAEEATVHPDRNVITRALGGPGRGEPDLWVVPVQQAERLLLCTDGVSGLVDHAGLEQIMLSHDDPRDAAERVVAAAVAAGGDDNATAVVVDVMGLTLDDDVYDSAQQRSTLEQKLGALP